MAMDCKSAFQALTKPIEWPRYRVLLNQIETLSNDFYSCSFQLETHTANTISREIARSVLKDGRFQSYLSLGGPSWLHDRIAKEAFLQQSVNIDHYL